MRRRDFIALLGATAAPWPRPMWAQQAMPVVGFLRSARADAVSQAAVAALRAELGEAGFHEGRNVAYEMRWGDGRRDRLPALAMELVAKPVNIIVANGVAALAAKNATSTVPIVFATGTDPVRDGLVASFNRPGGNVTGVSFLSGQTAGKRLELLRQLVPHATTIAALTDPSTNEGRQERHDLETAAQAVGQQLVMVEASAERDLEPAFAAMVARGANALLVGAGAFLTSQQERVVGLALRHRLPAVRNLREFAAAGGLMSYGTSITDAYRQAGTYVARILKGERPGDLPVVQAAKFEMVLNLKTAKALGLTVPMHIHAAADEVIE